MEPDALVERFFLDWGASFDAMCGAFGSRFAAQTVWDQRPPAATTGPDEALAFLSRARRLMGLETIRVEILSLASAGSTVLSQRVDHLERADGSVIVSAPVAGAMEVRDDRIVAWKEYFDPTDFVRQALVGEARRAVRRLRRRPS